MYDVGILTTGILPMHHLKYNIPPKATQFHTYGVCNTSLFSEVSQEQRPGFKWLTALFYFSPFLKQHFCLFEYSFSVCGHKNLLLSTT